MAGQKLFSIAPHAPFLPTLVDRVFDGTLPGQPHGPFGLADLTIFVPTQRARQALAEAILLRNGGAVLLPDIRTFGEDGEAETPFLPPFDAEPLPPAISSGERLLTLSGLVEKWLALTRATTARGVSAPPPGAPEVLDLAESLATLIDDFEIENVSPSVLSSLPIQDSSGHWQQALGFLNIVIAQWPEIVRASGHIDATRARNALLARQAAATPLVFGHRPVIAAGSTGSIPATAALLYAISELPNGAVVLPGLDTSLDAKAHESLLDQSANPQGHSQYGLARLLRRMGTTPVAVVELAKTQSAPRTTMLRQALALPADTALWAQSRNPDLAAAASGLAIIAARTEEEEARAIAIAARAALAQSGKRVGIVSPDRNLARRIAAELARFGITVDDSAGTPLFQTRAGRLARQILALITENFAPVALVALLRNRYVTFGLSRGHVSRVTDLLELAALRGQRPNAGIAGLKKAVAANHQNKLNHPRIRLDDSQLTEIIDLIDRLEQAVQPLAALAGGKVFASQFASALGQALNAIAGSQTGQATNPPGFDQLIDWTAQTAALSGQGLRLSLNDSAAALKLLLAGISHRQPSEGREDIAIWGLLEARLQSADLMILAGLNENIWPAIADPGPWLSRNMAMAAGLEPPERRQGQMAHDFEMALGNPEILMCFAERIGTSPALPSRLLQRLEAYLDKELTSSMRSAGATWLDQARRLDAVAETRPAMRPVPAPAAAHRPRSLSVTEIETLVRSPYDLYARYVLKLRKLDPLGEDPDNRERGTLVHDVLARYIDSASDPSAPQAFEDFMRSADEVFEALDTQRERRAVWRKRLEAQARAFLRFEVDRQPEIARRHAELSGTWEFPIEGEKFTLRGRADRIDLRKDGQVEILDFKTGTVPKPGEMKDYLSAQLLLEALMVKNGAFAQIGRADTATLTYLKLVAGPQALEESRFALRPGLDIPGATDELFIRLQNHIREYLLSGNRAMAARIMPNASQTFASEFDHLARVEEWTLVDGQDDIE